MKSQKSSNRLKTVWYEVSNIKEMVKASITKWKISS